MLEGAERQEENMSEIRQKNKVNLTLLRMLIDEYGGITRVAEKKGFSLSDFQTVIDKKVSEWKGTDMEQYLRPSTLFGTKFESYLNAPGKQDQAKPTSYDSKAFQQKARNGVPDYWEQITGGKK
jgi:hypothetical protein